MVSIHEYQQKKSQKFISKVLQENTKLLLIKTPILQKINIVAGGTYSTYWNISYQASCKLKSQIYWLLCKNYWVLIDAKVPKKDKCVLKGFRGAGIASKNQI